MKRLRHTFLLAAVAVLTGGRAQAGIVYLDFSGTPVQNTDVLVSPFNSGEVSTNSGSVMFSPFFWLFAGDGSWAIKATYWDFAGGPGFYPEVLTTSGGAWVGPLSTGDAIGGDAVWRQVNPATGGAVDFDTNGTWLVGDRHYLGFRFMENGGADWRYGWMDVQVAGDIPPPGDGFRLYGFAFTDTDGATLLAGQVPEPGTLALGLLALGAAVGARRLRRHARR